MRIQRAGKSWGTGEGQREHQLREEKTEGRSKDLKISQPCFCTWECIRIVLKMRRQKCEHLVCECLESRLTLSPKRGIPDTDEHVGSCKCSLVRLLIARLTLISFISKLRKEGLSEVIVKHVDSWFKNSTQSFYLSPATKMERRCQGPSKEGLSWTSFCFAFSSGEGSGMELTALLHGSKG